MWGEEQDAVSGELQEAFVGKLGWGDEELSSAREEGQDQKGPLGEQRGGTKILSIREPASAVEPACLGWGDEASPFESTTHKDMRAGRKNPEAGRVVNMRCPN